MPDSARWRSDWVAHWRLIAHSLALYGSTPLPQALAMPVSEANAFFEGQAWRDWRKAREQEAKLQVGIADRLNSVIRGENAIVKTLAALGRR